MTYMFKSLQYPSKMNLLLLFVLALGWSSCKKAEETIYLDAAYMRVINMSPTLATYNIYANDVKMNTAAIPFGGAVSYSNFEAAVANKIMFTTASNTQSVLTKNITLDKDKIYSLYLIDKGASLTTLLVNDVMAEIPSQEKCYVKFLHLGMDAPALTLSIKGGAELSGSRTYQTVSEFKEIDPEKYTLEIKDAATGAVKTTLENLDLKAGRYYTIVARGLLNPGDTDRAFSAQTIINQ